MRTLSRAAWLTAIAGLAAGVNAQPVVIAESEPNDTKGQADIAAGLVHGDRITGQTIGNNGLPATSPDYFLVSPAPLPLGIYRHQLNLLTTPVNGILSTIRGIDQTPMGVIIAGTDVMLQTGAVVPNTTISNTWYGFGRGERVYVRIQGASASLPYTFEFATTPALITPIAGTFLEGTMTLLVEGGFGNPDAEIWVYDANLNPVSGFNNDDPKFPMSPTDRASFTRNFVPGTYYAAIGIANMANHLVSPMDEATPGDDDATDFAGALVPLGGVNTNRFGNITWMDQLGVVMLMNEPIAVTARWYRFEVVSACEPAQFVFGPASVSVSASQPVLLESLATGTDPIAYQWRRNGVDIPGATQTSYSISAATLGDAGSYTVFASNACGSAESAPAIVSVMPLGPVITTQPQPQSVCIGSVATFSVSADGHLGVPLSYQWRKDGLALPWGQSSTLEVNVTALADGGMYDCEVTEPGAGATTSDAALLTIKNDPPAITLVGSETMILQLGSAYTEPGATATDDCDPVVSVTIGGDPVNTAAVGMYVVTHDAMDSQGNAAATVNRYVHVVDTTPPKAKLWVTCPLLWYPNHWLRNVGLKGSAWDAGDPTVKEAKISVRVMSDEPEVTNWGAGFHSPDAKSIAVRTLRLRAERRPQSNGRVYLIMGSVTDASGNTGYAFNVAYCPMSNDAASLLSVICQAGNMRLKAENLAKTAASPQAIVDGLKALGYFEHGLGPVLGPHQ